MAIIDLVLFTVTGRERQHDEDRQPGDGEAVIRPDGVEGGQDPAEELEDGVEDLPDELEQRVLGQQRCRLMASSLPSRPSPPSRRFRPSRARPAPPPGSVDPTGLVDVSRERHQIDPVRAERSTAHEPARRQGGRAPESVHLERLEGVVGATGVETTRRHPARRTALIGPEQGESPLDAAPGRSIGARRRQWPSRSSPGGHVRRRRSRSGPAVGAAESIRGDGRNPGAGGHTGDLDVLPPPRRAIRPRSGIRARRPAQRSGNVRPEAGALPRPGLGGQTEQITATRQRRSRGPCDLPHPAPQGVALDRRAAAFPDRVAPTRTWGNASSRRDFFRGRANTACTDRSARGAGTAGAPRR